MKIFSESSYTIHICTDIIEWAKEFYEMPEDSELLNIDEVSSEFMGFAQLEEKLVWIFVPLRNFTLSGLKETLAHEIGHIIELKYPTNPSPEEDQLHELKADHYMNYYLLVDKLVSEILNYLKLFEMCQLK